MNIYSGKKNILIRVIIFIALSGLVSTGFKIASPKGNQTNPYSTSNILNYGHSGLKFLSIPDSTEKGEEELRRDTSVVELSRKDSLILKARQDSIRRIDSLAADSTARIKYFSAKRDDYYVVLFRPKRRYPLFIEPSSSVVKRVVELDSTGSKVIIKELIGNYEYRILLEMSLEDYINLRLASITKDEWEKLAYKYELKDQNKDLSQLITDITNIEIPLPSKSLFSIFGPPKINIKIAGAVDIHGAWRNETTEGITTSALGNTRNEPDFRQQVQINLSGTIGDKLNIAADWNTERTFQYENQLKLKYTGYEDEIIQSIEAGNVSLQTSPLIGGSEALFGIKANFQLGPLKLTALASQKKGETQEVSVSGGSKSQEFQIHAYDYSPNHFFVHEIYTDPNLKVFNRYFSKFIPEVIDSLRIKEIEVWKTYTGLYNPNERKGHAFIDLRPRKANEKYDDLRNTQEQTISGVQEIGVRWIKLQENVDYEVHPETGFISFKTQIQQQEAVAVAFRREGPSASPNDDIYYGEFLKDVAADSSANIVLLLVKPPNLQPQFKKAWKLQLKNIYAIGGREINKEGFKLDIKYQFEGGEAQSDYNGIKLIQAFGFDKTDESGTGGPDGAFDFIPSKTIIKSTGEIIFPVLEPFGEDLPSDLPSELRYDAVYDTTVNFARQDRAKDKFLITGEYTASVTSSYNIGFNVVENSVKVLLNGNALTEGVDYTVDYNIGQVIIRKPEALVPGADLKITYEQNDLFQMASKTLVGLRGLYEIDRNTTLGFSFLNLNQQTLSDKVRIGEEPLNNSIFGLDFKTSLDMPFLTKAIDYVIPTSTMSKLVLNAEYAYMSPDPNTKKSAITSDEGKSIAYIDDFEGAKRIIPLGMQYGAWKDISVPNGLPFIDALPEMERMNHKAKAYWFNRTPSDVTIYDLYAGRKNAAPDQSLITALDFVYIPDKPGFYNWNPDLSDKKKNWAGMMKLLSTTANNLIEENIEFIEFWVKVEDAPPDLKLNIDLGQISEDIIPNGKLDTEDKNFNDLIDEGEDTGIDGWIDEQEPNYDPVSNPDPSNDNYFFQLTQNPDYTQINGTQGNAVSIDIGRLPDSEDLNHNFTLDRVNSYFRYEVPIDTNRSNPFIQGGGDNAGWYLFRIPLKDYVEKYGDPSFSVVETIRFWVSGTDRPVHLRFAEMNLVGNQWQKVLEPPRVTNDDTVLTVSVVNVEDNPEYHSPPGVQRERDRSQPDYDIYKNEQSLELLIKNLEDGDKREVVKYLYKPLDLFNYKQMKLFVHADENDMPGSVTYYESPDNYSSEVYIRFGSDSLNFYEYRQPLKSDNKNRNWNEVKIIFSELTAIKQRRDSSNINTIYRVPVEGEEGHTYGIRGNPTLTRISFFTIGIINPADKGTPGEKISGSVWINELRVLEADDTPGWAYSLSGSFGLADVMRVSFNASQTNPYFHRLTDRFGSRNEAISWGVSVDLDLLKLIPLNLAGSNFRIVYSRNERRQNPLFKPGTDIKVSEAQTQLRQALTEQNWDSQAIEDSISEFINSTRTYSLSESWALSNVRFKVPTDLWYIRDLINNLTFSFNYNRTTNTSPTILTSSSWQWNGSIAYSVNLSRELFFRPADIPIIGSIFDLLTDYKEMKVYFAPQTISAGINTSRKRNYSVNRTLANKPNIQRDFTASRNAGFTWAITEGGLLNLSMAYSFDVQSSLAYLLLKDSLYERSESEIWRDIFNGEYFGRDFNYRQSFDIRTNPKIPTFWDLNRYVNVNASYGVTYNWVYNFNQEELGRSAGYSNRISAGMTVRLKSIFAPLFQESSPSQSQTQRSQPTRGDGRGRGARRTDQQRGVDVDRQIAQDNALKDSAAVKDSLISDLMNEAELSEGPGTVTVILEYLKLGIKWLLIDYDQISFNFSQSSSYTGGGLKGEGTGFNNFWGFKQSPANGPSRLFMLGFSNDVGQRSPFGNLTDNYTHKNDIDMRTSRPLWEGAQLDISWKVGWGINKSINFKTDENGLAYAEVYNTTGTLNRSFLFFPFGFGNGISKVHELYNKNSENPTQSLSDAFVRGFETTSILGKIPVLSKLFKYVPRPNWSFSWTGLEKYELLSFAKRITINHAYSSNYSEGWLINPDGIQEIQTQKVDYSFTPLLGITFQFDNLWGGSLQSTIRYTTRNSYSLGSSTRNITESLSRDINVSLSYSKSGFDLPLFGISLKNDLEISISYTNGKNSTVVYNMDSFKEEGTPQDGKINTVLEPKIKYVMSSRVTLSIFYRRSTIEPQGASRVPPTTTNEAGVDVRIAIQ
ncbi:gliding motility-related protein [Melioribacter roseus P3M-2]|uniref:Gliding motility-related protein n=1 Tax=Melioribacter roseus (strain DSM 23840 / JCM 17771 / VKM B-2668 / P3M-2) TaxID=1191523 RepID=I6ZUF3_MELRP|nr:cell surface protein SprA [Melioribacter roseus]AFN75639.1 gliding motility-related protein [Melioribacter roseus P3M-2]